MRRTLLLIAMITFVYTTLSQAQTLKGDGQIFWEEHFDWEDPDAGRGWTLPEGWLIEDHSTDETGYVWEWTKDAMQGPFAERDGGYILNSSTGDNGFLAIDMDNYNAGVSYMEMKYINSSITLPRFDFSEHSSVILRLEQMFKYFGSATRMEIEVSNDNGQRWAAFDMKMGTAAAVNTMNLPNDEVAHFTANLSAVAAGMPDVIIKITWESSILYFWMLDDITLAEGWTNDLQMMHYNAELVDDDPEYSEGFMYMMPKTQILPMGLFEGSVINNGEIEQYDVYLNVNIDKNGVSQFNANSDNLWSLAFGDPADTLRIVESYTPVDYGHYELTFTMMSEYDEQTPDDNTASFLFHITDSVFARTPDVSEAHESPWRSYYTHPHEGDIMGTEFNPTTDCEASSISAYISKANLDAEFKFVLMEIIDGDGDMPEFVELLSSEVIYVDEAVLEQGWVTLPLDPDGVGEFLKAGHRYLAGVQFWTFTYADDLANRGDAFWLGSTQSFPGSSEKQWTFMSDPSTWTQGSQYDRMIRLNINNHENIIDGIEDLNNNNHLGQNYPNPFSSYTEIEYRLETSSEVSIEIYDLTGKMVRKDHLGFMSAGNNQIRLDAEGLQAGIYYYTLRSDKYSSTKKMVVVSSI